jgi:hypothetical protein
MAGFVRLDCGFIFDFITYFIGLIFSVAAGMQRVIFVGYGNFVIDGFNFFVRRVDGAKEIFFIEQ